MRRSASFFYDIMLPSAAAAVDESVRRKVIEPRGRPGSFGGLFEQVGDDLLARVSLNALVLGAPLPPALRALLADRSTDKSRGNFVNVRTVHPTPPEMNEWRELVALQLESYKPVVTYLSADWEHLLHAARAFVANKVEFGQFGLFVPQHIQSKRALSAIYAFAVKFSLSSVIIDCRDPHAPLAPIDNFDMLEMRVLRFEDAVSKLPRLSGQPRQIFVCLGQITSDQVARFARMVDGIVLSHPKQMLPDDLNPLVNALVAARGR